MIGPNIQYTQQSVGDTSTSRIQCGTVRRVWTYSQEGNSLYCGRICDFS